MTWQGLLQIAIFVVVLFLLTKPVGIYLSKVFNAEKTFLDPLLSPVERLIYRLCGIKAYEEQTWSRYALSTLTFSFFGFALLMLLLMLQGILPFNPQNYGHFSWDQAFNIAVSFMTNTNWQSYAGETSLSYFSQMVGLTVQNFVSAATGIAVAIALVRGLVRRSSHTIGNFWVDLTRATLWVLLPLCIILTLVYVQQGTPQNLQPAVTANTLEGTQQIIAQGPVASQEAIKSVGTNGGGFFNANSSHPYENPTPLTNFLQMLSIFIIGTGLVYAFGRMAGNEQQGWAILKAMAILFIIGLGIMYYAEGHSPLLAHLPVDTTPSELQAGGNMEGKEVRFGIVNSVLYSEVTTAASNGGINSNLDSYTPMGGMIAMINMGMGEIIIGGVGSGLYTILLYTILALFLAGLMVGRTPEFLGKKIEAKEMKMVMIALLAPPLCVLSFTALACLTKAGLAGPSTSGPHGFSQILYGYLSATVNNGSAFAGLNANTPFYNVTTALCMLIGRFLVILPVLALAGSLVQKKCVPVSEGTFPTTGTLFVALLLGVIFIVVGLSLFPAITLGPIAEDLFLRANK
ncbi:potassium-transporting ATPase subunit KdpA [soil metagenome]